MKNKQLGFDQVLAALKPQQQRTIKVFAGLIMFMLAGLTLTGIWQFFALEPNQEWFDYVPGREPRVNSAASGVAGYHDLFGLCAALVVAAATGWFAFRVSVDRILLVGGVTLVCLFLGGLTGALARFNVIKIRDVPVEDVGPGYPQLLTNDVAYVVNDAGDLSVGSFLLIVFLHVVTVPIIFGFGWWGIRSTLHRRATQIAEAPKRTWTDSLDSP